MTETVVTIVGQPGSVADSLLRQAAETAKAAGAENVTVNVLETGVAADLVLAGHHPGFLAKLRAGYAAFGPYDVFVQANDELRRKRLLVADMDATMVEGETLDELAAHFGLKDKVAPITAQAMRGEIDFAEALRMRVALLNGMPVSALQETLDQMRYSKGAKTLVRTMRRFGAQCVLISGGFDFFTVPVAQTLGFNKNIGNRLGIQGDVLTGEVIPPIVDKNTKKQTVESEARALGLDPRAAVAVGDGANDIPMLQTAGAGVGYFGKPAVVEATPFQIRHTDLTAILYMQGYTRREFAA
ncbi:MAG TPA: phosphoserine phosphatase SerB [Patescibacteria group bacterium]|nr:phosphoserine phosphatase SerB [Patescibacteria group bacterium]